MGKNRTCELSKDDFSKKLNAIEFVKVLVCNDKLVLSVYEQEYTFAFVFNKIRTVNSYNFEHDYSAFIDILNNYDNYRNIHEKLYIDINKNFGNRRFVVTQFLNYTVVNISFSSGGFYRVFIRLDMHEFTLSTSDMLYISYNFINSEFWKNIIEMLDAADLQGRYSKIFDEKKDYFNSVTFKRISNIEHILKHD